MMRILWIWSSIGLFYATFFSWYTSLSGPLTEREIDRYLQHFEQRGVATEKLAMLEHFMRTGTGDDFAMLNNLDMYETPLQVERIAPGDSSGEVLDKYMEHVYPALFARASFPVFFGKAANIAMDILQAPGMEAWSQGVLMRYRSRRDFFDITTNPAFSGSHDFKIAAPRKTIAFPLDPWFQLGDPRSILALLLGALALALSCFVTAPRATTDRE